MSTPAVRTQSFPALGTEPLGSVYIGNSYGIAKPKKELLIADEASIYPGLLTYLSKNTYANEVTRCGAEYGMGSGTGAHTQSLPPYIIEIDASNSNRPLPYDKSTAGADLDSITGYRLRVGDRVWLKGSSLTCNEGTLLVCAANGLVTTIPDVDGVATDSTAHGFVALSPITSATWVPAEYLGLISYDGTA